MCFACSRVWSLLLMLMVPLLLLPLLLLLLFVLHLLLLLLLRATLFFGNDDWCIRMFPEFDRCIRGPKKSNQAGPTSYFFE
jgi:hypothetical protein